MYRLGSSLRQALKIGNANYNKRFFSSSIGLRKFNLELETEIRGILDSFPSASKLYQNPDGSPRTLEEEELKKLGKLSELISKRDLKFVDEWLLSSKESSLFYSNCQDLAGLVPSYDPESSGKIIDKIPYEDPVSKEVKWKIVREKNQEGWEFPSYYVFTPLALSLLLVMYFKQDEGIETWAKNELRLRAQEAHEGSTAKAIESLRDDNKTPEEIKERDALIVERIIAGDYDKLAGLKIKANTLVDIKDITN
ncbi:uncharacterized protein ASCRUDRAFT_124044 [Ascoidea rubescens DSM 1968]|uniref:Uncharacterized protein n=1 Tax=Ascoidea rubescens DSM 1968 TaxID=1344418 RepID=A0A1D2VMJ2_9ASCO|nr:hypothetical protein ASCRUDRAFT_124044 [Ascoidea rubescens DSM 1968]ODV62794.1 hypothetical protein ASCRUDRAFT_124044 [Ascoidea rubescens DSM 1968]